MRSHLNPFLLETLVGFPAIYQPYGALLRRQRGGACQRPASRRIRWTACENFSMVFQDVCLFNDTLEDNIAFGTAGATHEQVVEAAKRARCHDFISAPAPSVMTIVGGRLAFGSASASRCRGVAQGRPIVVLDEATASIDRRNEAAYPTAPHGTYARRPWWS